MKALKYQNIDCDKTEQIIDERLKRFESCVATSQDFDITAKQTLLSFVFMFLIGFSRN